jgi:putative ABC transport system ATP-binding protein
VALIETRDLRRVYELDAGRVVALDAVSLDIEKGDFVAVMGPSGSGKSTFMNLIGCLDKPTGGHYRLAATSVEGLDADGLARLRNREIGFVFQQFNLFPALTALENVEYALNIKGVPGREARKEAQRVLEAVGLADRLRFLPRDLSGGQKQRVAIARALAGAPPVVLADEPTANLDSQVGMQVLEMFRDLAKQENRALLIVTHDPKVRTIADRVVQIRDGRLAA